MVGWYATALPVEDDEHQCIADTSSLIHEFYAGEAASKTTAASAEKAAAAAALDVTNSVGDPIHLVLDTSLQYDAISIKAYKSTPLSIGGEAYANLFHELPMEVVTGSLGERLAVQQMLTQQDTQEELDVTKERGMEDLVQSMEQLLHLIESVSDFVDRKVEGPVSEEDAVIGRQLYDALASLPRIRPDVLETHFHEKLQDLLMVSYLSQLTKTQLVIAEKLNETLTLAA